MRVPSHGTVHRTRTGGGDATLAVLLAAAIGLFCPTAEGQSPSPDSQWPPLQFESMGPRADRRDPPIIRDYVAEVLANPPQSPLTSDTESSDATAGPRYGLFHAAAEQQNSQRQVVQQFYDNLGTNETGAAGTEVWTFRDEAMNFTYTPPDALWAYRTDGPNPMARLTLFHLTSPPMLGLVEVVSDGPLVGLTLDQFVETLKAGLAVRAVASEVIRVEDRSIHGLSGKLVVVNTELPHSGEVTGVYWVAAHGGRLYTISVCLPRENSDQWFKTAESLIDGFRILDRNSAIPSPYAEAFTYTSPDSGFSLNLGTAGWRREGSFLEQGIAAEIGALHRRLNGICVSAIPLHGQTPSLQAAVRAMLMLYGFPIGLEQLQNRKNVQNSDTDGVQFDFEQVSLAGLQHYRCQVFLKDDRAYLVCVTAAQPMFDEAVADEALAAFRLDHPGKNVDLTALSASEKTAHSHFINGLGLHEFERGNLGGAATYFRLSASIDDRNPLPVENLVEALMQSEQHEQALQAIDHYDAILWNKGSLPVTRVAVLLTLERFDESKQQFRQLLKGGYWNEGEILTYLNALWTLDSPQAALDELLALPSRPGPTSRDLEHLRADLLVAVGRADEAIGVLDNLRQDDGGNCGIICSLIAALREAGREDEAIILADKAITDQQADVGVWLAKGITEFQIEQYARAKESLETANRMAPGVPVIEELLGAATAALGQGDTQLVSSPIDPVSLPAGVELADLNATSPLQEGAAAYWPWRINAIDYERDGQFRRTQYLSVVPADQSAVEGLSTLSFTFNPQFEELYLNRIEVFDPQGQRIASADRHSAYLRHEKSGVEATDDVTLNVPVPGLRPGYRLEAVVTTRDLIPPTEFPYQFHLFGSSSPEGYNVLLIHGDVEHVKWVGKAPVSQTDDQLVWVQRHVPGVPSETQQVAAMDFMPYVELADAGCNWQAEVQDYLQRIDDRLATPPATARLARQITSSSHPGEIIPALAAYVQKEFTYQALEFGRHTQVMARSDTVIANKYGDCKDLSLLLWQMLREHGINAHLALVHSSGELTPELPTIDQCDHMVVYLPDIPGGHVLDPTCRWGDPRLPVPSSLDGSHAVLLDPADPRVVRLPECPADRFQRTVLVDVRFDADGSATIHQQLRCDGYAAEPIRSLLAAYSARDRADVVRQYFTTSGRGIAIDDIQIDNVDDLQKPLVMRLSGSVRSGLYPAGERLVGDIPLLSRVFLLSHDVEPPRVTPFEFVNPLSSELEVRLTPPPGWEIRIDADDDSAVSNDFLEWKVGAQPADHGQRVVSRLLRRAGCFPADRRSEYLETVDAMTSALLPRIELRPVGTSGVQPATATTPIDE
jgi:tetratricopeptide (TPR) repeat protein